MTIRPVFQAQFFDAIVVGSGISGGWAAKELCEKGLKVLMLERGKPVEHPNYPTATLNPWQVPHASRLTTEDIDAVKKSTDLILAML